MGRGVTVQSTSAPIAYHQQMLATVKPGRALRAACHSFSPSTSALCWRHSSTSPRSRKYQPFPTMPCSAGIAPVRNVDCTVQVTAGSTVPSDAWNPASATARSRGMCASNRGVSPTTSMTTSGAIPPPHPSVLSCAISARA